GCAVSLQNRFRVRPIIRFDSSAVHFAPRIAAKKLTEKAMRLPTKLMTALAVASPLAYGQTSVTLYGRLDGGVEYLNHINNGQGGSSNRWSAEGGDWGTSMLGLKGNEDLG